MREYLQRLRDRTREWLLYPNKADREAVRRSERVLRAFMEGDSEYLNAEMVRLYGAHFFAAMNATMRSKTDEDRES